MDIFSKKYFLINRNFINKIKKSDLIVVKFNNLEYNFLIFEIE